MFAVVVKLGEMKETVTGYLAWLFGEELAESLSQEILLSNIVWKAYANNADDALWCEACGKLECKCPLLFVTADETVRILSDKMRAVKP